MKNSKLLIVALFITLTAFAQVKTGGGPDNTNLYSEDQMMVDSSMMNLMDELKANDLKCSKTPRLKIESNIVQVYVKLAVMENLQRSDSECEEAHRYLACLNTKTTAKYAKEMLVIKDSAQYVGEQFNIKPEEASKIMKYFAHPKRKK